MIMFMFYNKSISYTDLITGVYLLFSMFKEVMHMTIGTYSQKLWFLKNSGHFWQYSTKQRAGKTVRLSTTFPTLSPEVGSKLSSVCMDMHNVMMKIP